MILPTRADFRSALSRPDAVLSEIIRAVSAIRKWLPDVGLAAIERRGWLVVEVYHNAGISGAKGRKDRPTAMTEGTHQDRGGMTALSSLRWISDTIEKRSSASSLLMSHVIRAA